MNRGKGRNRQENNHSETREGKERETKGNTEKCGKIRRSAEKYDVRKRWKSAEMTLGKIIVKVKCHVMSHKVLRYVTGDLYSDSAGEASDASSMGSVDPAAAYSDESSLDSVHPGSVYSDSRTASQSDIKSPPSTDPGDALTDNEGELPSDSASLSSVHAGDAFSETSSPPHLSGLSDIEMQDKPNPPAMPPGHVANLSSPESSLAIGSHLHGFEMRGPFTASSFADIPTDCLNLDECEEDPDAPENLAPGD